MTILPNLPRMTWEANLDRYGNADSIAKWKNSNDPEENLFGNLLEEMKKLEEVDLNLVNQYRNQLLELAHSLDEGLSVSVSDLVSDARRLLNVNGMAC